MSGLEAFSLACNVMTVISFGLETVKLCRKIQESGSSDITLETNARRVRETSMDVERLLTAQRPPSTESEIRLRRIATECIQYAKDVEKEIKYTSPRNDGLRGAIMSTFRVMRRKRRLDELHILFEASRRAMDTAVTVQIFDECIASGDLNRSTYDTLAQDHKELLTVYEHRSRAILNLIKNVHDHITAEHSETRNIMLTRFDTLETTNADDKAYLELLDSLKYAGMNERKNRVPQRHDETFEWIYEMEDPRGGVPSDSHASLLEWLRSDGCDLFWVSGKPGSGKSTLMKFVASDKRTIDALSQWHKEPKIISHFLWKPGKEMQQSFHGLLCSLLHQVWSMETSIVPQLLHWQPNLRQKGDETDWDLEEVKQYLFTTFQSTVYGYLILLDGLDELAVPHGGMDELFRLLDKLVVQCGVKLCVSSRPEGVFTQRFNVKPTFRMQDLTRRDIHKYTIDFLENISLRSRRDDGLLQKITEVMLEKANGVFIWVYVVLKSVKNGIEDFDETWDDTYERIMELPPDLMKLYKDMWSRLGGNAERYVKQAALSFQLVSFMDQPGDYCSIATLATALDDDTQETFTGPATLPAVERLVQVCDRTYKTLYPVTAGLLETRSPLRTPVRPGRSDVEKLSSWKSRRTSLVFIHRTAIDFLQSEDADELFGKHMPPPGVVFSRYVKAVLVLGCVALSKEGPVFEKVTKIINRHEQDISLASNDEVFPLVLRCAADDSIGLLSPYQRARRGIDFPGPSVTSLSPQHNHAIGNHKIQYQQPSLNPENTHKRNGLVASRRSSDGSQIRRRSPATKPGLDEISVNLLQFSDSVSDSSSTAYPSVPLRETRESLVQRNELMRLCLQTMQSVETARHDLPASIMLAWRDFLLSEARRASDGRTSSLPAPSAVEVIKAFRSRGALGRREVGKLLVAIGDRSIRIPSQRVPSPPTIYVEVNDILLLQWSLRKLPETLEPFLDHQTVPFMRPVLAVDSLSYGGNASFFSVSVDASDVERTEEWIIRTFFENREQAQLSVDDAPEFLKLCHIGDFPDELDALRVIGCDIPKL